MGSVVIGCGSACSGCTTSPGSFPDTTCVTSWSCPCASWVRTYTVRMAIGHPLADHAASFASNKISKSLRRSKPVRLEAAPRSIQDASSQACHRSPAQAICFNLDHSAISTADRASTTHAHICFLLIKDGQPTVWRAGRATSMRCAKHACTHVWMSPGERLTHCTSTSLTPMRSCAASYAPSAADIAGLRSPDPAQRHCSLLRLLHAAKRGRTDPNCVHSWVAAGAVRAVIAGIAAAPFDEAAQQVARLVVHESCVSYT
jgi:hypothetical protein